MKRLLVAFAWLTFGCGSNADPQPSPDPEPQPTRCTSVDVACEPTYEPTYDAIFTRVLQPTCGKSGSTCHSSQGHQGGLSFEDADVAYDELLESSVRAGDAACSELMVRLQSDDPYQRMPPPAAIPEADRCAIVRWIQAGARR